MWAARRMDVGWGDLAAGLAYCLLPEGKLPARAMACLSVRSGFDLLLTALELPAGSEVLMSAATIPDMARIVAQHGLVAVPVDIDLATLAPGSESIERATTTRSRALVVAHLLGTRVPMTPLLEAARSHGLFVIEDLAQGFAGWPEPAALQSDAVLYSFGPIKTATALGGGLVRVRDDALLARLTELQAAWPRQSRLAFAQRLFKFAALHAASTRPAFDVVVQLLRLAGCNYDRLLAAMFRGFPGPALFRKLRRRPSAPLVSLLARRLRNFDRAALDRRTMLARQLIDRLAGDFFVPGSAAAEHTHWATAVLAADPPGLIASLACAGFHATQARSLAAIAPPANRPELAPRQAQRLIEEAVFLPVYPAMPAREIDRLADVLLANAAFTSPLGGGSGPITVRNACAAVR